MSREKPEQMARKIIDNGERFGIDCGVPYLLFSRGDARFQHGRTLARNAYSCFNLLYTQIRELEDKPEVKQSSLNLFKAAGNLQVCGFFSERFGQPDACESFRLDLDFAKKEFIKDFQM